MLTEAALSVTRSVRFWGDRTGLELLQTLSVQAVTKIDLARFSSKSVRPGELVVWQRKQAAKPVNTQRREERSLGVLRFLLIPQGFTSIPTVNWRVGVRREISRVRVGKGAFLTTPS